MKVVSIKKVVEVELEDDGIKLKIHLPEDHRFRIKRNGELGVSLVKNLKPDDIIQNFSPPPMLSPKVKNQNPEDWLNEE